MNARVLIVLLLITVTGCDIKDHGTTPPVASFSITPEAGASTDTFRFDAGFTETGGPRTKAYYRWDWNHDGVWDNEYTQIPVTPHRFYKPGTYRPLLGILNSEGLSDTMSVTVAVEQGYSAPHPSFTIAPDTGNMKTLFVFDASASRDDEDSLGQLRFMWDFEGNGSWDTPLSANPVASHIYMNTGNYEAFLEVADPRNLRTRVKRTIRVTDINYRLVPDFSWTPSYGTLETEFILNGSTSYDPDHSQALFRYSWKLPPGYEWTPWTYKPDTTIKFEREAAYDLEMRIMDTASLVNYCKKTITVYHKNLPPDPKFTIGCRRGNILTQFYFTSWPTVDQESLPTTLETRWDFNGDGQWDTDFGKLGVIYHNYPAAGTYKVYLEARDPDGLSDTTAQYVEVSPWTNETGLIFDQRDGQIYGTVKIGNQWWMSQNLDFEPWDPNKDNVLKKCISRYLGDPVPWCNIMGGIYNCYHATREDWYGEVKGICPYGWHIPSRKEWETLVSYLGGSDQADKLLPGGPTDFNALYAGYGRINATLQDPPSIHLSTYYWSFNKMVNPYAPNSWYIGLEKGRKTFVTGWASMEYYHSVRCVKNED
jgi:uncharacterized protein (TIGR02145 family)